MHGRPVRSPLARTGSTVLYSWLTVQECRWRLIKSGPGPVYWSSDGQQLAFALLEPAQAGVALASWAMPVAARVIGDGGMPAVRALVAVATQAAVRQRVIASSTLRCCPLIQR